MVFIYIYNINSLCEISSHTFSIDYESFQLLLEQRTLYPKSSSTNHQCLRVRYNIERETFGIQKFYSHLFCVI